MSKRVTYANLSQRHRGSRSKDERQTKKKQSLPNQSDTFRNLEQLTQALIALEAWQAEVKKKPRW
jgi:hypothetical protein